MAPLDRPRHAVPGAPDLRWFAAAIALVGVALGAIADADDQLSSRPPDIHFTPTRQVVAEAMLALAGVGPADTVYDLGSGDGRLVVLAAQLHGARGVGIEIQPHLVELSRRNALDAGVADRVRFVEGDLFTADLSDATVVVMYLSTSITRALTPRLQRDLTPGTRIVSQQFLLDRWPPEKSQIVETATIHLWTVPKP